MAERAVVARRRGGAGGGCWPGRNDDRLSEACGPSHACASGPALPLTGG